MARELLGAHTPSVYPYPPYIKISREGGEVVVTLREAAFPILSGRTLEARFSEDAFRALWREVGDNLGGV